MSKADQYLQSIISKHRKETGANLQAYQTARKFMPTLRGWAGETLIDITFAGSYAKGTGVEGSTDIDLLILLDAHTCGNMKDLYENLYSYLDSKLIGPIQRNLSIGVNHSGIFMDILLARRLILNSGMHDLYCNIHKTSIQTNTILHNEIIGGSGFTEEIQTIKIWRNVNRVIFPSFYLELTVLDVLANRKKRNLSDNILEIFFYLEDIFVKKQVCDPVNLHNIISDELTIQEKLDIATLARRTRLAANWEDMIW